MLEWSALIVLVPLVLVPIVLFFGFAGCDVVFQLKDPPAPFLETFEVELPDERPVPDRCVVTRIEPGPLSVGGTEIKLFLQRPTIADLTIRKLYVSAAADGGNDYDALVTPIEIEQVRGRTFSPDPDEPVIELDPVPFTLDPTKPLLIAINTGISADLRVAFAIAPSVAASYVSPLGVQEAELAQRSFGYTKEPRIYLVHRIEVR